MLRSGVSEIPRLLANEPSSLLPIGRECPIFHGVGSMPCAMFRQLKYRLIGTHVYSIESKDRLTRFGVTMFLYRIIGNGRNRVEGLVCYFYAHCINDKCLKTGDTDFLIILVLYMGLFTYNDIKDRGWVVLENISL